MKKKGPQVIVLNDVGYFNNLKIYQKVEWFSYSLDSILLANFVEINKKDIVVDFCTGNGIIPIYISNKYKENKIYGIEIQKKVYDLALKSVDYNNMNNIVLYNDNINNIKKYFTHESVDIITCNPPYFKTKDGNRYNINIEKAIARHELHFDLDSMCKYASYILKNTGTFYMVYRPNRLDELILILSKYNMVIKQLQFCYPKIDKESNIMLLKIKKGAKQDIKLLPPIIVHDEDNNYKPQILNILGK